VKPTPIEFFDALYRDADGYITVSQKNGSGWADGVKTVRIGEGFAPILCDGESESYFRVQPQTDEQGARKEANTANVLTLFADFDFAESSDKKKLAPFNGLADVSRFCRDHVPLAVSAVIMSGHGAHVYWFLTEPLDPDTGKALLVRFDQYLRGKAKAEGKQLDAMHDLARVLRVPGSINVKHPDKPVGVTVEHLFPDRTYTPDDCDWIPDTPKQSESGKTDTAVPDVEPLPEPLPQRIEQHYEKSVPDRSLAQVLLINDCVREGFTPGQIWNAVQSHPPSRDKFATRGLGAWWREVAKLIDTADEYTTEYEVTFGTSTPPAPFPEGLRLTDADNSTRLVHLHGDRMRWVNPWKSWIVWDGTRWARDPQGVRVLELAKDVSRALFRELAEMPVTEANEKQRTALGSWAKQSAARNHIEGMVILARGISEILIEPAELDADPWALCVLNGWINLKDGTFHPPDPAKLQTLQATVRYDPQASAPQWETALTQWLPDPDVRSYFQRLCGEAAVGSVRDHILVLIFGDGANGKGTAIGTLENVLGEYLVHPHHSLLVKQRHETHSTEKAALFRTRLAVAAETDSRVQLNEASIKELTGGDVLMARRLYENPWKFTPTHTLWLQTNYLPEIEGLDTGIWRRVRVLPWTAKFLGTEQDTELKEKLEVETPGVLNWIVAGCRVWQQVGLQEPEAVNDATAEYRQEEDVYARFLTAHGYEYDDKLVTPAQIMQVEWAEWTANELGKKRAGQRLSHYLKEHGCVSKRDRISQGGARKQVSTWHGIGRK
jgi:putative DNA primase/helicase